MKQTAGISGYRFASGAHSPSHAYLLPCILGELEPLFATLDPADRRLFDLGCGNGSTAAALTRNGWSVQGVDPSETGIAQAQANYPEIDLQTGSAYEDLAARFGTFPVLVSLEVVEHLYDPRSFARRVHDLLMPGGTALISTPFHGYLKNLAIAVTGQTDAHFDPLWDHGHIKFWSIPTLTRLLHGAGLKVLRTHRVGRVPALLAKSMVAVAQRPQ
jgi:2-polyprenyl-6-hydroxyphenyl methylase/3-demethylubiquinone-9 3-methyltransferase